MKAVGSLVVCRIVQVVGLPARLRTLSGGHPGIDDAVPIQLHMVAFVSVWVNQVETELLLALALAYLCWIGFPTKEVGNGPDRTANREPTALKRKLEVQSCLVHQGCLILSHQAS